MNLFKSQDKMEEALRKHLKGMQYKPSDGSWKKIESELGDNHFEQKLQMGLEDFEMEPSDKIWAQVEEALPIEGNGFSRWFYLMGLGVVLISFSIYAFMRFSPSRVEVNKHISDVNSNISGELKNQLDTKKIYVTELTKATPKTKSIKSSDPVSRKTSENNASYSSLAIKDASKLTNTNYAKAESSNTNINASVSNKKGQTIKTSLLTIASTKKYSDKKYRTSTQKNNRHIGKKDNFDIQSIESSNSSSSNAILNTVQKQPENKNEIAYDKASQTIINQQSSASSDSVLKQAPSALATSIPDTAFKQPNTNPSKPQESKISISILAGANYSFMSYAGASPGFESNIALRKKIESPDIDWSGGFLLNYHLTKRISISSGVMLANFRQSVSYNTTGSSNGVMQGEQSTQTIHSSDSFVSGGTYANRIKYSWTEIPLFISYQLMETPRFSVDMMCGVSYAFIQTVDAIMISKDNVGAYVLKNNESFPGFNNSFFLNIYPVCSYRFNDAISLGLSPSFKYSINSMVASNRWTPQHPYLAGLSLRLTKRF